MYKFTKSTYFLELYFNNQLISTATGFFIKHNNKMFLITNKHVVTGKHVDTGDCLDWKNAQLPNNMKVLEPITNELIACLEWNESFPQDFWIFAKEEKVDIAIRNDAQFNEKHINLVEMIGDEDRLVSVTEKLAIVGYPYGKSVSSFFPTYVTGFLATELNFNYNGLPLFLVDSRTREGQSGSPVYYFLISGKAYNHRSKSIDFIFGDEENPAIKRFLGIYSGRISKESDLGRVWKVDAIISILDSIDKNDGSESD